MTPRLIPLPPTEVAERLSRGAVLVDIREPDEFARQHVSGAISAPLSAFEAARPAVPAGRQVIFTCRTGMRTGGACERLAAAVNTEAYVLDGGLDAWRLAGLPLENDRKAPLEMMRQVQIAAGLLVLTGVAIGLLISPVGFLLSAFVGAGLTFAGVTGYCGMARLLAHAPWNRAAA